MTSTRWSFRLARTRGKSIGLADLLEDDPKLLERKGVHWWIGSSGTFDAEIIGRAKAQGVRAISNLYGSSEFAVFAISCVLHPGDFHIAQGYVLVEVVDRSGNPVQHGHWGRIVVSHLCGIDGSGGACVHRGTQILRLATGDEATFHSETCDCGLTTPRLRGIRREAANGSR